MLRQYDLKRVNLAAASTASLPIAVNPGHEKGLIFLPSIWDGGLTLTYFLSTFDFRTSHLSGHVDGEAGDDNAIPPRQVPPGPIIDKAGAAVTTVGVAGSWAEIPLIAMIAPRLVFQFTVTTLAQEVWLATKA